MEKHFAWCSECLRTAVSNDKRPYHKLLWSLKAVKCCHVHGVWLQSKCPNPKCRKNNSEVINVQSTLQCPSCGHNLYDVDVKKIGQAPKEVVKRTLDLANLVQVVQDQPTHIATILKNLLELSTDSTWNGIHKVAEKSGIDRHTIENWFTGKTKPQLDYLLTISESYSKVIGELLVQTKPLDDSNSTIPPKTRHQAQDRLIQQQKIESILLDILNNRTKAYSLNEIVKESGATTYMLKRYFSGICSELTSPDQVLLTSMREYLTNLLDSVQWPFPSLKQLANNFGINVVTLRRHFPELCSQISSARRKPSTDQTRLSSIHEYLTNLVNSDDLSYPSLRQIANQLKISSTTLQHHFPELCSLISPVPKPQRINDKLLASIYEYLNNLVSHQTRPYPSLNRIANQFGVDKRILQHHFPELCLQITSSRNNRRIDETRLSSMREYLLGLLNAEKRDHPLSTIKQIAKTLRTTDESLRRYFPELCFQLSSTRYEIRQMQRTPVHEYLTSVLNSGVRPCPPLREIANKAGMRETTLRSRFPELCSQISSLSKYRRIDQTLLSSIRKYMVYLVNSKQQPYPPLRQIAKKFGISETSLRHHFPELCTQL